AAIRFPIASYLASVIDTVRADTPQDRTDSAGIPLGIVAVDWNAPVNVLPIGAPIPEWLAVERIGRNGRDALALCQGVKTLGQCTALGHLIKQDGCFQLRGPQSTNVKAVLNAGADRFNVIELGHRIICKQVVPAVQICWRGFWIQQ